MGYSVGKIINFGRRVVLVLLVLCYEIGVSTFTGDGRRARPGYDSCRTPAVSITGTAQVKLGTFILLLTLIPSAKFGNPPPVTFGVTGPYVNSKTP